MGHRHGEDFKREAVRLALSSGLSQSQVAADLGIGLSTLGKWIAAYKTEERGDVPSADLLKEVEQLRSENRVLKEERDILKIGEPWRTLSSRARSEAICFH
jgi:transposase